MPAHVESRIVEVVRSRVPGGRLLVEPARRVRSMAVTAWTTGRTRPLRRILNPGAETVISRIIARPGYEQPAARTLLHPPLDRTGTPSMPRPDQPLPPSSVRHAVAPPPTDVGRLSEEVYRHLQRRVRIERERRRG